MVLSLPFETQISDLGVDKNGQMEAVLSSVSVDSLETLLVNLTNQEKNSDLIRKIELNSLAVGKDGQYRFSLSITPK